MTSHFIPPPHHAPIELQTFIETNFAKENIFILVQSQLNITGSYAKTWLCITDKTLYIIEELQNHGLHTKLTIPLINIETFSKVLLKGGGLLVCKSTQGPLIDVIRYPDSQAFLFAAIADRIKTFGLKTNLDLLQLKESLASVFTEELSHYCKNCSRPYTYNTKVCNFCINRTMMIRRILQFAYPYRYQYILLILLMATGSLIQLLPSIITGKIIDSVIDKNQPNLLIPLLLGLMGAMITSTITNVLHARLGVYIGSKITASIREKTYSHLHSLSLNFFDKQASGAIMNRISGDAQAMQSFLVEGVQYSIYNVLLIIGIATTLFLMNPLVGIIVVLPVPLVVYISKKSWTNIHFHFRKYWDASSLMYAYLSDSLSGVREIKTTGQEDRARDTFAEKNNLMTERLIRAERNWQSLIPFLNLLIQSSLLLVWYFGVGDVLKNSKDFTTGNLITMIGLMGLMFGPLQLLTRLNDWVARALASAERIFEILDTKPKIEDATNPADIVQLEGSVEFRNVLFGYEKHKPIINHLSLKINPGEMIGFVGKSGVGKSTLMKLLLRLYDVDEGEILIDGINIKNIKHSVLSKNISVVLQDSFLFHGSIAENIAFAKPEASRLEIIKAAMLANAHEFIMKLPNGYDAFVGERGANLSGGERQRIAIARALISDPKILILDEATASVDTETEQRIQQALQRLVRGRTTFAIAHRLSTLRNANRLYVIENGEIKETGTHEELMNKENGVYKGLVSIQTEWARNVFTNNQSLS